MDTISSLVKQVRDVNGWSDLSNEDIIEQVLLQYLSCSSCPLDIAYVLSERHPGQE